MGREIERKFLVTSDAWRRAPGIDEGTPYQQAYLVADAARSVRVRVAGASGYLTVKGPSVTSGNPVGVPQTPPRAASRDEFEYAIPADDARAMIARLSGDIVAKTRYRVPFGGHTWEVDVFEGDNAGLVVAEVELGDEAEEASVPPWVGQEVTADVRYLNANLAKAPFRRW